MKGPVKLSLAIALALAGGNAFALGLGVIRVKSGLNQPLDAEIPVISESPAEINGLNVDIASPQDFERIGLSRARLTVSIDMSVSTDASGQTVVKLSTKDPVREPLLDLLLVANWPNGKLLREYTILLDPPITAPARASATVAPVAEKPAAAAQPLPESRPAPKPVRAQTKPPVAAAETPAPRPAAKPAAPPPSPKPAAQASGGGDYGPVAQGETLSEIARATRPDEKTSVNQMMLALLKANPNAFFKDNINALKRGAILRIPTNDEVRATGTVREAIEEVRSQNDAWTGRVPVSAPTLVAHTGASTKPGVAEAAKAESKPAKQERIALVPPGKSKSESSTERAGSAGGTGKESAEVKAELARTKEALASREQEASELKSRVKQLEDIGSKDQRLIAMKDSEIADLQRRLKDLQSKASAAPAPAAMAAKPAETAAKPAETMAAAKPEQKITAKDIWGDLGSGETGAAKPATPAATPASSATQAASTPAPATTGEGSMAAAPSGTPPATASAKPAMAPKPTASSTKAIKPSVPAKVTPLAPAAEPFYKNQNVLLGGGAALLLVGLLALFRFMRKPKASLATSAGAFDEAAQADDDEELRLRDALEQNPGNTSASLELLRHYYSQGDAAKFETAAESMHAHLLDPSAPEWDEVLAMGAVLAPNHPLFSAVASEPPLHDMDADAMPAAEEQHEEFHHDEFSYSAQEPAHEDAARTQIAEFDLDAATGGHEPDAAHEPEPEAAVPAHDDGFDFDLPLQTEETPPEAVVEAVPEPEPSMERVTEEVPAADRVDDIYVGEDAIGTKLDLAKAYLDMGDPEGARSMLDEVMTEGNDSQKDEARKLLAEIR
jgi:pilus assembly protein FimV